MSASLLLVAGYFGRMAQYSPTAAERSNVPMARALSTISSLLLPISGRQVEGAYFARLGDDLVLVAAHQRAQDQVVAARVDDRQVLECL